MAKKMTLCDLARIIETEHPFSFYYYNSRDQREAGIFKPLDVSILLSETFIVPNPDTVIFREENGQENHASVCIRGITSVILSEYEMNIVSLDFFTVSPSGETRIITIGASRKG